MNRHQRRAQAVDRKKQRHVEVKMVFTNGRHGLASDELKGLPEEWDVMRVMTSAELGRLPVKTRELEGKYLLACLDRTDEIFALPRDREGELWKETKREPRRLKAPFHVSPTAPRPS
jgi:hypothetical protein